jgi:hypothetical protein
MPHKEGSRTEPVPSTAVPESPGGAPPQPAIMPPVAEKLCRVCKKTMPAEGLKCTECDSYQNWRRIFSLSTEVLVVLVALVSVLGVAIPEFTKWLNRHSHSQVRIVGATRTDLFVIVLNTGREPSTPYMFRASFVNLPLSDAKLYPFDLRDFQVPAAGSRLIRLRPQGLTLKPGSDVTSLRTALRSGTLTIIANIKESTDEGAKAMTPRYAEYPTENLKPWISHYVLGME